MSFEFNADPQFKRNQDFHDACRTGDKDKALRLLDENPDDKHLIDVTRSDMPAILMASDGQHWDLCKELIERGVELNVKNRGGFSPIHIYAIHGHEELLRLAVENACYVNRKDNNGMSPLHFAAKHDQEAACEVLLSLGAEVNSLTKNNDSAMHWASRNGNQSLARKLVERGGYAHGENDMAETPITLAKTDDMRAELERADLQRAIAEAEAKRKAEEEANPEAAPAPAPAKRRIAKA
jgi:ankyrin repeat protein